MNEKRIPVRRVNQPSREIMQKLEDSKRETGGMEKRELRCPFCNYRIMTVYLDRCGHIEVKCQKCKFEGPINLSYFRRQKIFKK